MSPWLMTCVYSIRPSNQMKTPIGQVIQRSPDMKSRARSPGRYPPQFTEFLSSPSPLCQYCNSGLPRDHWHSGLLPKDSVNREGSRYSVKGPTVRARNIVVLSRNSLVARCASNLGELLLLLLLLLKVELLLPGCRRWRPNPSGECSQERLT